MDSFGILWGVTFGNHDYNSLFSADEYVAACQNSRNGILYGTEISESYSNYYYKIAFDGKDVAMLFCMDTKKQGLTAEHVKWYEDALTKTSSFKGELLPSFVFFHIPPKETAIAAELYADDKSIGSGNIIEEVGVQYAESGFFDKAAELKSTKAIFYGHDHLNNAHIVYRGIELCYAMKTGKAVYYEKGSTGATLLTIQKDGTYDIERIYVA